MFLLRTTAAGGKYGLDVDAMLADVGREQFNEWIALYRLEPWGDDWMQTGTIAAAIHNMAGKVNKESVVASDFVPNVDRIPEGLTDQQMREKYARKWGTK